MSVRSFVVLFFSAVPLLSSYSADNWLSQQTNVNMKFTKCIFVNVSVGWVAGDSGVILHTTNGGLNWVRQTTGISYYFSDLFFLNANTGWGIACDIASFPKPVLLKTTNSGSNWLQIFKADTTFSLATVYFKNEFTGWLAGYGGLMLNSTDGGFNWSIVPRDTSGFGVHSISSISFKNTTFGYACGGLQDFAGVVWKSDPSGLLWSAYGVSPEPIYKVIYDNDINGFGVGGDPEFGLITVKTTNGGSSWVTGYTNLFGIGRSFARRVYNEIWVPLTLTQNWAVSTNNGESWAEIPTDNNVFLNDVFFADSLNGWAVGDNGVIQKYNNAVIGLPGNHQQIVSEYKLDQNYPNPFNQSTIIEFSISKPSIVKLSIFDALGRELKVVLNEFRPAGNNKIFFDPKGFASGIYFYKLSSRDFTETKKLIIVK